MVPPKNGSMLAAGAETTAVCAAESSNSRREHIVLLRVTEFTLRKTL